MEEVTFSLIVYSPLKLSTLRGGFPARSRRSAPRAEILEFVSADRLNLPRPFRQNGYSRVTVSEKRPTKTQLEAVSGLGYPNPRHFAHSQESDHQIGLKIKARRSRNSQCAVSPKKRQSQTFWSVVIGRIPKRTTALFRSLSPGWNYLRLPAFLLLFLELSWL